MWGAERGPRHQERDGSRATSARPSTPRHSSKTREHRQSQERCVPRARTCRRGRRPGRRSAPRRRRRPARSESTTGRLRRRAAPTPSAPGSAQRRHRHSTDAVSIGLCATTPPPQRCQRSAACAATPLLPGTTSVARSMGPGRDRRARGPGLAVRLRPSPPNQCGHAWGRPAPPHLIQQQALVQVPQPEATVLPRRQEPAGLVRRAEARRQHRRLVALQPAGTPHSGTTGSPLSLSRCVA